MAEAEPPTNYEDAYSTLPGKIKLSTVRKDILESIRFKQETKESDLHQSSMEETTAKATGPSFKKKTYPTEKDQFEMLIGTEHCGALISDAFWYYICHVEKEKPELGGKDYRAHIEFLLDRMAANYVSYTLLEDPRI
jgi:hypothetical protein